MFYLYFSDNETQLQVLGGYLHASKKTIKPVDRNGPCILLSVREVLLEAGIDRSMGEQKDILINEIKNNTIYKDCSTSEVEICAEIQRFFDDPTAAYVKDSVDLVLPALCRALHIKGTVYKINREGQITTMPVGTVNEWEVVAEFARTEILHVDHVVKYVSPEKDCIEKEYPDERQFSCDICFKQLPGPNSLSRHVLRFHPSSNSKKIKQEETAVGLRCPMCTQYFHDTSECDGSTPYINLCSGDEDLDLNVDVSVQNDTNGVDSEPLEKKRKFEPVNATETSCLNTSVKDNNPTVTPEVHNVISSSDDEVYEAGETIPDIKAYDYQDDSETDLSEEEPEKTLELFTDDHGHRIISTELLSSIERKKVTKIPSDIDGNCGYEITSKSRTELLSACRDGRSWKYPDSQTKWKGYDSVRYKNCNGCLKCPNIMSCWFYKNYGYTNKLKFDKVYTDTEDKFYVYDVDENDQIVFKTSRKMLEIAREMNSPGNELSKEFCFFDVKVKRTSNFTTLTASLYYPMLGMQLPFAIMECVSEDTANVELFWRLFNRAYREANQIDEKFMQFGRVTDMATANFAGLAKIYGDDIIDKIKGCEFHYLKSANEKASTIGAA